MQGDLADMRSEGSSAVVVLAVDVVGNRSAHGNEAGAGVTGRNHPLGRNTSRMSERLTPLSVRSRPVDSSKPRMRLRRRQSIRSRPALRQESAVTAAEGHKVARSRPPQLRELRQLIVPRRLVDVMVRDLRVTSPRENPFSGRRICMLLARGCDCLTRHS